MNHPRLNWDIGTAYDLFISLSAISSTIGLWIASLLGSGCAFSP